MMRALVTVPGNTAVVKEIPKPIPASSQILVFVKAVAVNPVDALYVFEPSAPPGRTVGSDFCGVVEAWGSEVTDFIGGELVAGFVHGACTENTLSGAFAEHVLINSSLVFRVPKGMTPAQAATLPLCFMTAAQALHLRLKLPVTTGSSNNDPIIIAINGASSSVGQYSVQLAKLAGCKVIGTTSNANLEFVNSLGADITVDYRSPLYSVNLSRAATSFSPASLTMGLDCIAEGPTTKALTDAFAPTGGRCIVLRSSAWKVPQLRSDIQFVYTAVWSMLGVEIIYNKGKIYPASSSDYAHAQAMYRALPELLLSGRIKPNRVRFMEGGLDGIMDGLDWIGGGDVSTRVAQGRKPLSAEKMVYEF
ncbi:GroES-like protein [Ramaria rubella]|nr:GroES-like protein [Ramaria rubella]